MKKFHVTPSTISGKVVIPPSKSHTMRAILYAALADGTSRISHFLPAPDTNHMIEACRLLGASIQVNGEHLEIKGVNGEVGAVENVIDAGNSGIILRFVAAVSALSNHYTIITGDHSIRHLRPMKPLLEALNQLGVSAVSARGDNFAPLIIRGPLKGGKAVVSGEDSQPVSSLLMACALAEGKSELTVKNPGEKPWIDVTLGWFDRLGIPYKNENYEKYTLPGGARFKGFDYAVPGDWSSAAFPLAAALVTRSELILENVDMLDTQGDKKLVFGLQKMGAKIEIDEKTRRLHVKKSSLKGAVLDINEYIDAITILAAVACYAEGETRIVNASVARQKECDRLHCIAVELRKMGAEIEELPDSLVIQGSRLHGAHMGSHGDHRMAMSLAVAALGAKGVSEVHNVDCVTKTFPRFAETFEDLGAQITRL